MEKGTTRGQDPSRVTWDHLEEWVRGKDHEMIQTILEEGANELLGWRRSERCEQVDSPCEYLNWHGKKRNLTFSCGTITLRRLRVRGLEGRFESRVLPLFARRTREVNQLIPELYLHGLDQGDFDLTLCGLLEKERPSPPAPWPGSRRTGRRIGPVARPQSGGFGGGIPVGGWGICESGSAGGHWWPQWRHLRTTKPIWTNGSGSKMKSGLTQGDTAMGRPPGRPSWTASAWR
jgi:hypothetical protein